MLETTVVKSVCALAMVTVLATGCTKSMTGHISDRNAAPVATATTPAATLRTALNALLSEHVILAAAATGAALDGRDAEFKAAAGALDANSVDIAKAIGSVYGTDAEQAFLPLWRRHIGFAVDYTVGVATKDRPGNRRPSTTWSPTPRTSAPSSRPPIRTCRSRPWPSWSRITS